MINNLNWISAVINYTQAVVKCKGQQFTFGLGQICKKILFHIIPNILLCYETKSKTTMLS